MSSDIPKAEYFTLRIWFDSHNNYEIGPHFIKEETYLGVKILKIIKHRVGTLGFEPGLPWEFMLLNTSEETVLASSRTLSDKEWWSTVWGFVYQFGNVFLSDLFLISDLAYLSCWVNGGFGAYCFPVYVWDSLLIGPFGKMFHCLTFLPFSLPSPHWSKLSFM